MDAKYYSYPPLDKVQCPRCGQVEEIPVCSNSGHALEYAGVCQAPLETGGLCGTMLKLEVIAHLFPATPAEGSG